MKSESTNPGQWKRSFLGIIALLLWSTTVSSARVLSEHVGTFTAASFSYLIGGAVGLVFIVAGRGGIRRLAALPRGYLVVCGGLFICYNILLYLAVGLCENRMQVLGVTLINYLWPSLMLIFTVIVLKRDARKTLLGLGLVISTLGAFLAAGQRGDISPAAILASIGSAPAPYLLALAAAVSWGLYSVLNKFWTEKANLADGHLMVPPVFLLSGFAMLAARPFFNETSAWSARSLAELAYLSLFPWLIAYALWAVATQRGKIVFLGVASMFLPLASTLINCLYLRVIPGTSIWAACVLIIVGAALCMKSVSDESPATIENPAK